MRRGIEFRPEEILEDSAEEVLAGVLVDHLREEGLNLDRRNINTVLIHIAKEAIQTFGRFKELLLEVNLVPVTESSLLEANSKKKDISQVMRDLEQAYWLWLPNDLTHRSYLLQHRRHFYNPSHCIAIVLALRIEAGTFDDHKGRCGQRMDAKGLHSLFRKFNTGQHQRLAALNDIIE